MKYELTEETIDADGRTLRRVRYLDTGELGGWIELEANLSQDGDARVCGEAQVSGKARVYGNAWVSGEARVFGEALVYGDARVYGDAWVSGDARVCGKARVLGEAQVSGGSWEASPLQIQGTRYFFSVSSPDTITVGCKTKTVGEWLESCEKAFEAHDFTERERLEYKRYFNLAAELYGWDVPLFPVGAEEGAK